jgi:hypothetical protein
MWNYGPVKLSRISSLLSLINNTEHSELSYIRRRFNRTHRDFQETFRLCEVMDLITVNDEILTLNKRPFNNEELKNHLAKTLLSKEFPEKEVVWDYFSNYKEEEGVYSSRPSIELRIQFSSLRNFLIELGVVEYKAEQKTYFITDDYVSKIRNSVNRSKISLKQFQKIQDDKSKIGLLAEQSVIKYEKNRLKENSAMVKSIEHTSQFDVGAGYDILSFEDSNTKLSDSSKRYIEVKAVSKTDLAFYWSRNEISKSKQLGKTYYLYLVPIKSSKEKVVENPIIISNPYKKVYKNESDWKSRVESTLFTNVNKSLVPDGL